MERRHMIALAGGAMALAGVVMTVKKGGTPEAPKEVVIGIKNPPVGGAYWLIRVAMEAQGQPLEVKDIPIDSKVAIDNTELLLVFPWLVEIIIYDNPTDRTIVYKVQSLYGPDMPDYRDIDIPEPGSYWFNVSTHSFEDVSMERWPCDYCEAEFATKALLYAHIMDVHKDKPTPAEGGIQNVRFNGQINPTVYTGEPIALEFDLFSDESVPAQVSLVMTYNFFGGLNGCLSPLRVTDAKGLETELSTLEYQIQRAIAGGHTQAASILQAQYDALAASPERDGWYYLFGTSDPEYWWDPWYGPLHDETKVRYWDVQLRAGNNAFRGGFIVNTWLTGSGYFASAIIEVTRQHYPSDILVVENALVVDGLSPMLE